jgi:hypothetical protein
MEAFFSKKINFWLDSEHHYFPETVRTLTRVKGLGPILQIILDSFCEKKAQIQARMTSNYL